MSGGELSILSTQRPLINCAEEDLSDCGRREYDGRAHGVFAHVRHGPAGYVSPPPPPFYVLFDRSYLRFDRGFVELCEQPTSERLHYATTASYERIPNERERDNRPEPLNDALLPIFALNTTRQYTTSRLFPPSSPSCEPPRESQLASAGSRPTTAQRTECRRRCSLLTKLGVRDGLDDACERIGRDTQQRAHERRLWSGRDVDGVDAHDAACDVEKEGGGGGWVADDGAGVWKGKRWGWWDGWGAAAAGEEDAEEEELEAAAT